MPRGSFSICMNRPRAPRLALGADFPAIWIAPPKQQETFSSAWSCQTSGCEMIPKGFSRRAISGGNAGRSQRDV